MPAEPLFLYGTLRDARVYGAVAGEALTGEGALLPDHAVAEALGPQGQTLGFPLFTALAGTSAQGLIVRPSPEARVRLDFYERVFGYDPVPITVQTAGGPVEALIYLPQAERWLPGGAWDLQDWSARRGDLTAEIAAEVMALRGQAGPEAILQRYGMLSARVASRRRARAEPAPATLRRRPEAGDVLAEAHRTPYTWFFGVEETDIRFRRFNGTHSAAVTRAGFIMADAVTVLPYDPRRDVVMLVEQFRYGPHARGDANAWSLEPIAGRIDPFEGPEDAARREALEEARLSLAALHPVARYYVSPGAVTEYLISYVGIADLPLSAEGVSGLEIEAEDIRAHVIPFDRLMALMDSGEIENSPLLISAQWLALNRARLRG